MMHTEEEARKLWCPMIRFQIGPNTSQWQGNGYTNRADKLSGYSECLCIASGCMMWRWTVPPPHITQNDEGRNVTDKTGYCGLGGKP